MDIPDPARRGRGMPMLHHTNEAGKPVTRICTVTDNGQWRDGNGRFVRYYASHSNEKHVDDDPFNSAAAKTVARGSMPHVLNTGPGSWIKSVTQNLCAGYHEWAARVTLDYGLLAFHVTELKQEMAKRATLAGSSKAARGFYDISAEAIKPFAIFDVSPTPQMQTTLLIDKWGLDPPRTLISIIGSATEETELPPLLEAQIFKSMQTMVRSRDGLIIAASKLADIVKGGALPPTPH